LVFDESKLAAEQKCADGYLYRFGKSDDGFYFQTERQLPVRARGIFTALHIIIITRCLFDNRVVYGCHA
jgi:hypothetical protein